MAECNAIRIAQLTVCVLALYISVVAIVIPNGIVVQDKCDSDKLGSGDRDNAHDSELPPAVKDWTPMPGSAHVDARVDDIESEYDHDILGTRACLPRTRAGLGIFRWCIAVTTTESTDKTTNETKMGKDGKPSIVVYTSGSTSRTVTIGKCDNVNDYLPCPLLRAIQAFAILSAIAILVTAIILSICLLSEPNKVPAAANFAFIPPILFTFLTWTMCVGIYMRGCGEEDTIEQMVPLQQMGFFSKARTVPLGAPGWTGRDMFMFRGAPGYAIFMFAGAMLLLVGGLICGLAHSSGTPPTVAEHGDIVMGIVLPGDTSCGTNANYALLSAKDDKAIDVNP